VTLIPMADWISEKEEEEKGGGRQAKKDRNILSLLPK